MSLLWGVLTLCAATLGTPDEGVSVPDRATAVAEALDQRDLALDQGQSFVPRPAVLSFDWDAVPLLVEDRFAYIETFDLALYESAEITAGSDGATLKTYAQRLVFDSDRPGGVVLLEETAGTPVVLAADGRIQEQPTDLVVQALGRTLVVHETGLETLLDMQLPSTPLGLGSTWVASPAGGGETSFAVTDTFLASDRLFYEIEYDGTIEATVRFSEVGPQRDELELDPGQGATGASTPLGPPVAGGGTPGAGEDLTGTTCTREYAIERQGTILASFSPPFVRVHEQATWVWQIPFMTGVAPVEVTSQTTTYYCSPDDMAFVTGPLPAPRVAEGGAR